MITFDYRGGEVGSANDYMITGGGGGSPKYYIIILILVTGGRFVCARFCTILDSPKTKFLGKS